MPTRALLLTLLFASPIAGQAEDLIRLLQQRNCPDCRLEDVDLVHTDLRDADLRRAQLQRANLGQARLDGADLRKSNLQFTNLRGASLRGADLRGSTLYGTHHRQGLIDRRRRDIALRQLKRQVNRLQRLGQKTRRTIRSIAVDHAPGSCL